MSSDSSSGRAIAVIRKFFSPKSDFFCYLIIFTLVSLLFLPIIISGKTTLIPEYDDFGEWMLYPEFIKQCFRSGYFPLWCEGLYSGLDFVGWGHSSSFYPLTFFFQLFQYAKAAPLNQYLHFLIGVFGFFFLSRTINLSRESALISSIGYGFAYLILVMMLNHIPGIAGTVFIPWAYALSLRMLKSPRISTFAMLTVILALQQLGGDFELFALQNLSLFLLMVLLYLRGRSDFQPRLRGFLLLLLALTFAGLLSSITLFPSFTSYSQSYRIMNYTYHYYVSSRGAEVYLYVLIWGSGFVSPIFCWFLYHGVRNARTPVYFSFLLISLFFLLNGINWFTYFSPLYFMPILNKMPSRGASLYIFLICLFVIFGAGVEAYSRSHSPRYFKTIILLSAAEMVFFVLIYYRLVPPFKAWTGEYQDLCLGYLLSRRIIAIFLIVCFIILMATICLSSFSRLKNKRILEFYLAAEFLITGFCLVPRHPGNIMEFDPEYLNFLSTINPREYRIQSVFPADLWYRLKIPIQTGVLYNTKSADADIFFSTLRYTDFLNLLDPGAIKYINGKIHYVGITFALKKGDFLTNENLSLVNLANLKYIVGQNKNISSPTSYEIAYEDYRFSPGIRVSPGSSYRKLIVNPPASFGLTLYFTTGDRLNMEIIGKDKSYRIFSQVFFGDSANRSNLIFSKLISNDNNLSLDLAGLYNQSGKLVFSFSPLGDYPDDMSYEASFTIDNPNKHFKRLPYKEIDVFENPTALPRAFLVHGAKAIPDKAERLKYLKSPDFDPSQTAVLNDAPFIRFPYQMSRLRDESVKYLEQESFSGKVKLSIKNLAPAIVILSEQYYPGWRAYIDGQEAKLVPVDHCFQAVVLPEPGFHNLILKYLPPSFELGLWVEITTILSWLIFLLGGHIVSARGPRASAKI